MEGKTKQLTVGCEIYCLELYGSIYGKLPSCFFLAVTPLNPCRDFNPRRQRIEKLSFCITSFVLTLPESLKPPQKGLAVGCFHAYVFRNSSSLEIFSAMSLMDTTLVCQLIGIVLWVADAAALEGANILPIDRRTS